VDRQSLIEVNLPVCVCVGNNVYAEITNRSACEGQLRVTQKKSRLLRSSKNGVERGPKNGSKGRVVDKCALSIILFDFIIDIED
jgi:hypothetical protein